MDPQRLGKFGMPTFAPLIIFLFTIKLYLSFYKFMLLMHFMDPIEDNAQLGTKFMGARLTTGPLSRATNKL
jgi:hypothetical protein